MISDELKETYGSMTTAGLEEVRTAFTLDRKSLLADETNPRRRVGAAVLASSLRFIDGRIALIENILGRRRAH